MFSKLVPSWIEKDRVLAEDDAGRVFLYGDILKAKEDWANKISGRRLVVLLCANTIPHLAAYIGLNGAGHVVILLPSAITQSALANIVEIYRVEVIVRSSASGDIEVETLRPPEHNLYEELSICLATSGSTGSPKLVRFSNERLAVNAKSICQYLEINAQDIAIVHLPFEYSYGLSVIHSHIVAGAKLLLTETSVMQKRFWERFLTATSFAGVPFHFEMLLRMRLETVSLPNLRTLTQAGGHMSSTHVEKIHAIAERRGWKFHVMYGQTEAGPRISWLRHDLVGVWPDSIGESIPGVTISLVDDELVVDSPSIMMGYAMSRSDLGLGDETLGRLFTGDIAEEIGSGVYRITGRKSRFLKLQGNRVSLQEIESRLYEAGGWEVHCVGQDDNLVICTTSFNIEDVRQTAIQLFSFSPRAIRVVKVLTIPRNTHGKVNYPELSRIVFETA